VSAQEIVSSSPDESEAAAAEDSAPGEKKKKDKKKVESGGGRPVETLFKVLYRNQVELTAIADTKANIIIGINGLLASVALGFVTTRLADGRLLEALPALIALAGCGLSLSFAIVSARPRIATKAVTLEDVRERRANLMFFGHFARLSPDDFVNGLHELMDQPDQLHDHMARDIHALGVVLSRKYRLLRAAYGALLATVVGSAAGLAISVIMQ